MRYNISLEEDYVISRINQWYIKFRENKIYGMMRLFGFDNEEVVSGRILAFIDNRVMVRINGRLYALVLGTVRDDMKDKKILFMRYLRERVDCPKISI